MDEKNNKIAHRRIVAERGIPRNHARINNSDSNRFAKMISDVKSLRISDIHIDVRAWEGKACNIVIRSFCGQRRFSVGTDQELMSEGKNLRLQRCTSLKDLPSRRKKRENDREHVAEKPATAA